jgi:hypothetical protein
MKVYHADSDPQLLLLELVPPGVES